MARGITQEQVNTAADTILGAGETRAQAARDLAEHACATLDGQLQDSHALRADLVQQCDRLKTRSSGSSATKWPNEHTERLSPPCRIRTAMPACGYVTWNRGSRAKQARLPP